MRPQFSLGVHCVISWVRLPTDAKENGTVGTWPWVLVYRSRRTRMSNYLDGQFAAVRSTLILKITSNHHHGDSKHETQQQALVRERLDIKHRDKSKPTFHDVSQRLNQKLVQRPVCLVRYFIRQLVSAGRAFRLCRGKVRVFCFICDGGISSEIRNSVDIGRRREAGKGSKWLLVLNSSCCL